MMKITGYLLFNLISFKNEIEFTHDGRKLEKWSRFVNRDDIIISVGNINIFIEQLRNIPLKKIEYLKYWDRPEHQSKRVIDTYDEITKFIFAIEKQASQDFKECGHDVFIIRMKDNSKINYLRESDLCIELEKCKKIICDDMELESNELDSKTSNKIDDLFKRSEIALTRLSEYLYQRNLNPNLKIQNKTGYSISEIVTD